MRETIQGLGVLAREIQAQQQRLQEAIRRFNELAASVGADVSIGDVQAASLTESQVAAIAKATVENGGCARIQLGNKALKHDAKSNNIIQQEA